MVRIIPENDTSLMCAVIGEERKISIQAVDENGTPVGKEIVVDPYLVEIGRVDREKDPITVRIRNYRRAIRAEDGKDITPIDFIVVRSSEGVEIIGGILGRFSVKGENDATHRKYIRIWEEGPYVAIGYCREGLFPVKVKNESGEYVLPPGKKIILDKGEVVYLHPSGTYTRVGETPDGSWIMKPAWIMIKHLARSLYQTSL